MRAAANAAPMVSSSEDKNHGSDCSAIPARSGTNAALFVSRDALNFSVIQVLVVIALFIALVAALALWPRHGFGKPRPEPSVSHETDQAISAEAALRASRRK